MTTPHETKSKTKQPRPITISLTLHDGPDGPRVGWSVRRLAFARFRADRVWLAIDSCPAFRGLLLTPRLSLRAVCERIYPKTPPSALWIGPPQWWESYPLGARSMQHSALATLRAAEARVAGRQKTLEEPTGEWAPDANAATPRPDQGQTHTITLPEAERV